MFTVYVNTKACIGYPALYCTKVYVSDIDAIGAKLFDLGVQIVRGLVVECRMKTKTVDKQLYLVVSIRSGQTIHWRSSLARVDTTAGVVRITAGDPIIRYVISGDTRRIPLPVPTTPMPQDKRTGRVSILGLPPSVRLDRTFPRLEWNGDAATADLRDIPSIVRVQFGSGWGVEQWSEAFVVVLVIVSSLIWYRRRARG